jgi:hypothetical protein
MKQLLARLVLLGCSLAAGIVQAVPVTFTAVFSGNAGVFNFHEGDRGLGDYQGTGPYTLTVSGSSDVERFDTLTVLDITLTVNGRTNRMQQEGSIRSGLNTFDDGSGRAVTVLSHSFRSRHGEFGPVFFMDHSLTFDPQVLGAAQLPDTGNTPLQSLAGKFRLSFEWTNDASGYVFGNASGTSDHGTLQVTSAVPEPEGYAMLIVGLALVGASLAKRFRA